MSYYDILNKQNLTLPEVDTFESVPSTPSMIEDDLEFCEIDNDNNVYFNKNNKDKFLNLFELARDVENLEKIADDENNVSDDEFEIMIDKTTDSCNFHQEYAVMCYNESDETGILPGSLEIVKIQLSHQDNAYFVTTIFMYYHVEKVAQYIHGILLGKDLIVPCITQHTFSVMNNNILPVFEKFITYHPHYICLSCFEKNGGHVHIPTGKGLNKKCNQAMILQNHYKVWQLGLWIFLYQITMH
nr:15000_t:CDS:2 [Entrophospora candida]